MATQAAFMPGATKTAEATGVWSWITTVDHKRIGILYGVSAFIFFLIGGIEALIMRAQLARPDNDLVSAQTVQRAVHDARHHDDLPGDHAAAAPPSSIS